MADADDKSRKGPGIWLLIVILIAAVIIFFWASFGGPDDVVQDEGMEAAERVETSPAEDDTTQAPPALPVE